MRARRLRRRRFALLSLVGLGAALLGVVGYVARVTNSLELSSIDTRFEIRGTQPQPNDLVVVQVDQKTLNQLQMRWPFPRRFHARIIDRLRRDGAKVVAYDVRFDTPTDVRDDNAVIRAVGRDRGHVVLAALAVNRNGHSNVFGSPAVLRRVGGHDGNTILQSDPGGVLRRFPFSFQKLDGFAVATVETATGHKISAAPIGGVTKNFLIDFRGPPGTIKTVSYSQVLQGKVPARVFRGKIVVVGDGLAGGGDVHAIPTAGDELMSGPEVQANAIWTVEHGFPLRASSGALAILLILAFAAIPPFLNLRLGPFLALAAAVALGALYAVVVQLSFNGGTVLPLTYPLTALGLAAIGSLAVTTVLLVLERQWVHDTFARFVPEAVVDEVLEQTDEDQRLGGVRRDGTVLFSDLRGFTSFSESLAPDQVVDVLNHYLGQMSEAIMGHGGTLVAYMGDGIMAIFGAPIKQNDHADRGLAAAREMLLVRLPAFNRWLKEQGLGEGFEMGIGLNSGEVMSGQVGSEQRMEYTAIGDTTNTASRLEGMTKNTPHTIFIAESTKEAMVGRADGLSFVEERRVRGREAPIRIWTLAETSDGAESVDGNGNQSDGAERAPRSATAEP
jgi:adenylate cyclase